MQYKTKKQSLFHSNLLQLGALGNIVSDAVWLIVAFLVCDLPPSVVFVLGRVMDARIRA
jgi:hypothetical protein